MAYFSTYPYYLGNYSSTLKADFHLDSLKTAMKGTLFIKSISLCEFQFNPFRSFEFFLERLRSFITGKNWRNRRMETQAHESENLFI